MYRILASLGVAIVLGSCTSPEPETIQPAPGLLSPAPKTLDRDGQARECVVGIIRADHMTGPELVDLLGAHVPTWLPAGFGLMIGWKVEGGAVGEGSNGGIWTDERCRQVRLEVFPGAADKDSPKPDGQWVREIPYQCGFGSLRHGICRLYYARSLDDAISVTTVGLSNRDTAKVVNGIGV